MDCQFLCPRLHSLKSSGGAVPGDLPPGAFANLVSLKLFASRVGPGAVRVMGDSCHRLRELNLEEVTGVTDEDWRYFLEKRGAELTRLEMDGEGNTDSAFTCVK